MFMPKTGISVTLRDDNLLWLKGRARATGARSLSKTLDDLVTAARTGRASPLADVRSVAGTIDIGADDPDLEKADAYIRDLFAASYAQPFLVRDGLDTPRRPSSAKAGKFKKPRG